MRRRNDSSPRRRPKVRSSAAGLVGQEHRLEVHGERARAEVAGVGEVRRARGPAPERAKRRLELSAPLGQLIHLGRRGRREGAPADDAVGLELAEALGEHVRARGREARADVGEALRARSSARAGSGSPSAHRPARARGRARRGRCMCASSWPSCSSEYPLVLNLSTVRLVFRTIVVEVKVQANERRNEMSLKDCRVGTAVAGLGPGTRQGVLRGQARPRARRAERRDGHV